MKATVAALLLSVFAIGATHANIVVVPSAEGCKKARAERNAEIVAICDKMDKGEAVNLACPIPGGCKQPTK